MPWKFLNNPKEQRACLQKLVDNRQFPEALNFLASALELRAAIEWAAHCLPPLRSGKALTPRAAALQCVEAWLNSPTEENRRAARERAELAGLDTPEGCLAMSVFFSGGSIAPPTSPSVPPPPDVCQKMIAGAVLMAVVMEVPENASDRLQLALTEPD